MPVAASDLKYYCSASMPEDDVSASGGNIDTLAVIANFIMASASAIKLKSTNAGDTMNVTVYGRNAAGAAINETKALTGTTVTAAFTNSFERVNKITIASAPAGIVSILMNDGTTVVVDIPAGKTSGRRFFPNAASEGSGTNRYEKGWVKNEHASIDLISANLRLTADPSEDANHDIQIGLAGAANQSVANRKTAPSSVSFVDENVDISLATIPFGTSEEFWVRQTLGANATANKSTFTVEVAGQTI